MSDLNSSDLRINLHIRMAKPQVNHIKAVLDKLFTDKIDLIDYKRKPEEEKRAVFYSRALAAYYLHITANIPVDLVGECITDGFGDNGIDAIHYDERENTLYLIQSKMISEGEGEPESGDMMKFRQGVFDIIDEKFDSRFNDKILNKQTQIKDALLDRSVRLFIVLVYTGKGFSNSNERVKEDLMNRLNDTLEWAFFIDFNLRTIYTTLNSALSSKPIDHDITLSNWGSIDEPYKTYYGLLSAYELSNLYVIHGKRLFDENIRGFIGLSTINTEILETIQNEPDKFIYFNNGVTLICDSIEPIPGKVVHRTTGGFHCKGIQVVNGAQTVGSLGTAFSNYAEQLKKCIVFVRLIPLKETPDNFGNTITIASNTQNKIEKKDFVTLDPLQHNLRAELALLNVQYHFKRTDDIIISDEKNCTLEEATVALACYNDDISYSVTAKREIGKLWDDIKKTPYINLFNDSVKGYILWNIIKIYRAVSKFLTVDKESKVGREKSTNTYGNYFILHIVLKQFDKEKILNPLSSLDEYLLSAEFKSYLQALVVSVYVTGESLYPTSLIHQLYRNFTKCKDLEQKIIALYENP